MRLDDWTVTEDDEEVGIVQLVVAFLTFGLILIALFGLVILTWAGTQP